MTTGPTIPNLAYVSPDVLRGGQPITPADWGWLAGQGVHTVVKLNTQEEGSDDDAEAIGFNVCRFPIPWWRQTIWRPRQRDLVAAVGIITSRIKPIFVHCTHGQDRTGLIIGCFRLAQGWSKAAADQEMEAHHFHEVALQGLEGAWNRQRPEDWCRD